MDAELKRLKEENQRLHRAVEELSVLNEIALALNSTMAPEEINELIVGKCVKRLGVEQGAIHLFGESDTDPTKTLVRVMPPTRISVACWKSSRDLFVFCLYSFSILSMIACHLSIRRLRNQ